MITNPWTVLPSLPPFVLPKDAEAIARFNARASLDHALHLDIVPEPFLGNPEAPVLLLNLNPGFIEADIPAHRNRDFRAAAFENLEHRHPEFPFYLLDPAFPSPGQDWWKRKLRLLIEEVGLHSVASNVFVVEIHGYHSQRFAPGLGLPSQAYTRRLVLDAISREATVVVMRGRRVWEFLVPELSGLSSVVYIRSVQNPVISPKNCPESFEGILAAVKTS
jgi:hypothetical protein